MNGCTFPGRMISSEGAVCFGETTDTAVRATCAVSAFSVVRALTRDKMPETNRAATAINAIARTNHRLCGRCPLPTSFDGSVGPPVCFFSSVCCDIITPLSFCLVLVSRLGRMPARTLQNAEKCWDKEQRRNRSENQATYDRPAKRSILFSAISQAEGHRHHANDHCQSGHQHGAETREACFQCGADGITPFLHFFRSKTHDQDAVGGCDAHAHDGPHECGYAESRVRYKQKPGNASECRGQRGNHDERIQPRLKIHHDQQVYEHDRERQSAQKADVGGLHRLNLPADNDARTVRQLLASGVNDFVDVSGHTTQIASSDSTKDVNHRRYVVVRNHCHSCASLR